MNLEDLYRLLRSSHVQAQGIVDTIDEPLLVLDEHGCVLEANRAFFSTFLAERDDIMGCPLRALGNGQWDIPELTRLIADIIPRSTAIIDYEVSHTFPKVGQRTFLLTARRLWKPDSNSTNVLLVFNDVTESREKERESSLLFSEMRHRMTNLLGTVRAIANQTETKGRSAEEYKTAFLGRFEALMNAQSLLSVGDTSSELENVISRVVGGLGGSRLHVTNGPPVLVAERQIVPLTMILHELGTNALKYGAFKGENGTVHVTWEAVDREQGRAVRLVWTEACASPISPPGRTSTGTEIIRKAPNLGSRGLRN